MWGQQVSNLSQFPASAAAAPASMQSPWHRRTPSQRGPPRRRLVGANAPNAKVSLVVPQVSLRGLGTLELRVLLELCFCPFRVAWLECMWGAGVEHLLEIVVNTCLGNRP